MFNQAYTFALIQTQLDHVFFNYMPGSIAYGKDIDYEDYNRERLRRYQREDRALAHYNVCLFLSFITCILLLVIHS